MKIVFILGAHRTGTKSLAQFFKTQYPKEVNAFHQYGSLRIVNVASNLFLAKIISESTFEWIVNKTVIKHIRENADKPIYLVSNGFNFIAAKYVANIYTDTLIIHAVRDPRTYVISYLNFIEGRWQSKIANELIPYWHPKLKNITKRSSDKGDKLSKAERFAHYWNYKNEYIQSTYQSKTENYLRIRIEDIWNENTRKQTLNDLLSYLSLNYSPQMSSFFDTKQNQSKGKKYDGWDALNISEREKIVKICSAGMNMYHYS